MCHCCHPDRGYASDLLALRMARVEHLLHRIEARLIASDQKENAIMADLTAITAAVANNTTVEESAIALIQGLASQITAAGTDPVALAALTDQLTAESASLAAAVAANTPAAPVAP